jgi:hypothetical protein
MGCIPDTKLRYMCHCNNAQARLCTYWAVVLVYRIPIWQRSMIGVHCVHIQLSGRKRREWWEEATYGGVLDFDWEH